MLVTILAVAGCQLWPGGAAQTEDEEGDGKETLELQGGATVTDRRDATALSVKWSPPVEVARGAGIRGPWRMNESRFHYVDDPAVHIGADGTIGVVWADNRQQNIFFNAYDAEGTPRTTEATNVSNNPGVFSWLPRVVVGESDEIYVLWQEIVFSGGSHGGEIFFARSEDGGKTFEEAVNLSNTTAGAGKGRLTREHWHNGSLDLVEGPDGTLYAAWTEYEGALRVSRSEDGGRNFSPPIHVFGDDRRPARAPSLAVDTDGTVYVAWTIGGHRHADIRITRSTDGGRSFADERVAVETDGHSDAPKLAIDAADDLHLVFGESSTGPFQRYDVVYTRSTDGGESFSKPLKISTTTDREAANFPSLAIDSEQRIFVVWERFPDFEQRPVGMELVFSDDRGQSFSQSSEIRGTLDRREGINGGLQGLLMKKIATHDGTIAIVHSRFRPGEASMVDLIVGQTVIEDASD